MSESESQIAQLRRTEICRLAESLPLVKVSDLTIPKSAALIAEDIDKQRQLEKDMYDLQNSLHTANADEMKILRELQVGRLQVAVFISTVSYLDTVVSPVINLNAHQNWCSVKSCCECRAHTSFHHQLFFLHYNYILCRMNTPCTVVRFHRGQNQPDVVMQDLTTEVKDLDIRLQGLHLELVDIGSDELEKCGYQFGSRGRQLFFPQPVCIDVESKTVVDSYSTHVRDLEDEIEVKKLSSTHYRMIVKPYSMSFG